MPESTHIREASSADAPLLTDIICNAFHDVAQRFGLTPENCPNYPSNCTEKWIDQHLERGVRYSILETNEQPVGSVAMVRASIDYCYLERLAVLPEHRGRGFGKKLVHHVCYEAQAIGARAVSIGIISKRLRLMQWFRSIGFVGSQTKEYDHLPFLVSFMRYELE